MIDEFMRGSFLAGLVTRIVGDIVRDVVFVMLAMHWWKTRD